MKPKKLVHELRPVAEPVEENYTADVYASPGAAAVLYREGQVDAGDDVMQAYYNGGGDATAMDPMDILIMVEEMADEQEEV